MKKILILFLSVLFFNFTYAYNWALNSAFKLPTFKIAYAQDCPSNSYMNYDWWCTCVEWYTANKNWDWCAKVTESLCYQKHWNFSRMKSDWSQCICLDWYEFDPKTLACEKLTDSLCKSIMSDLVVSEDWKWCSCKDWYSLDPDQKHCTKITDEWCEFLWPNAVLSEVHWENFTCTCKSWYVLDETTSKCVKEGSIQATTTTNITNEKKEYNEDWDLLCPDWEVINEKKTKCVADSITQRKLNCTTWFWVNSELSSENNDDCVCKEWYIWNAEETQCIPYSAEQMKLNCTTWFWEHSIVSEVTKCNCEPWYTWSYDETFCDVDLDQKSLTSRLINTIDAKCDTDSIINACNSNPTWDWCPAVCLEIYDAINWMYDNELTIYKDPKLFWIYNEITREQASKFFVNFYATVFDKQLIESPENPFNDIANADPTLIKYILNANILSLFKGNKWKFMPFNHLTKAQSLAVAMRMLTWILDENQNPWYNDYRYRAENLWFLENIKYSANTLDNEDIIRWDVALILYRLYIHLTYDI